MTKDYFKTKAADYEKTKTRVDNVANIADTIRKHVDLKPSMEIMDFGSGTGLLLERIAPFVKKITAVDVSESMNQQLEAKRENLKCDLELLPIDLNKTKIDRKFDGIISSMTLHHIEETKTIFSNFHRLLKEDAFLAIADLESEDGSFHKEDTGVFHKGFNREELVTLVRAEGFIDIETYSASIVQKDHGEYPVFLLVAYKKG